MFDIGFAELIFIGVVALIVIGPERLPDAIRTSSAWLRKIRKSFSDIKREVEQELHNDSVLQELRKTSADLKSEASSIGGEISDEINSISNAVNTPAAGGAEPPDTQDPGKSS